jgi:hypothetical protein
MKNQDNKIRTENIMKMVDEVIGKEKLYQPDPLRTARILKALENDVNGVEINHWNLAFKISVATIGLAASLIVGISLGGMYNHTHENNENIVMVHDVQIENLDYLIEE